MSGDLWAVKRIEAIGRSGFIVSVGCGTSGVHHDFKWTVHVLSRHGEEFERPFAAHSFSHAIEIADTEIHARRWMTS